MSMCDTSRILIAGLQYCGAPLSSVLVPVSDLSSECGVCPVRLSIWPGPASAEAAPPPPSQLCSSHLPASVTLASLAASVGFDPGPAWEQGLSTSVSQITDQIL